MKRLDFVGNRGNQSGAVLLVSLIIMVVLTLFTLAAINFTNTQSRIAGNLQVKTELKAAAQQAIEQVISGNFSANPAAVVVPFDVNSDGIPDYSVTVAHNCVSYLTIPNDNLVITNAEDASCTQSAAAQNTGLDGTPPGDPSLCANTLWDVEATAVDASTATFKTGASVKMHQGIGIRVAVGVYC